MRRLLELASKIDSLLTRRYGPTNREQGKVWAKWSYRTAELLVTMGYYFGAVPVFWNRRKNKMEMITSRFDKIHWICTISLHILIQVAILVTYYPYLYYSDNPVQFMSEYKMRSIYAGLSTFVIPFHLHTAWKYKEFVCFINAGAHFYEVFQSK